MRKLIGFALLLCLLVGMAGCASGNGNDANTATEAAVTDSTENTIEVTGDAANEDTAISAVDEFVFAYNGIEIRMNQPADSVIEALGEPMGYTEQPSCAFEGMDKTYYYGSFYLDTYPDGDKDYVYGYWFADDSVSTEEGIYIGASQAQVEEAYGADAYNGNNAYVITKSACNLTIILEEGVVSSIQYAIKLS